jgi:hypothetical protein
MATATSRAGWLAAVALAIATAGCGGGGAAATTASAFGWLHPGPAPHGWRTVALRPGGAALPVPPGWRLIKGDSGTASAAVFNAHRTIVGYLNVTPGQQGESLAGWAGFRPTHNAEEGNSDVRTLASATGLRFRTGTGSCVQDSYRTSVTSYREIACIVRGGGGTTVIVAAATPSGWARLAPTLERAVSAFTT